MQEILSRYLKYPNDETFATLFHALESDEDTVVALQEIWEGLEERTAVDPRVLLHAATLFHFADRLVEAEALVHIFAHVEPNNLEAWLFLQLLASLRGHAALSEYCIKQLEQHDAPESLMVLARARDAMLFSNNRSLELAWELVKHPISGKAMAVLLEVAARFDNVELVNKAVSLDMRLAQSTFRILPKNTQIRLRKMTSSFDEGSSP